MYNYRAFINFFYEFFPTSSDIVYIFCGETNEYIYILQKNYNKKQLNKEKNQMKRLKNLKIQK